MIIMLGMEVLVAQKYKCYPCNIWQMEEYILILFIISENHTVVYSDQH